MENASKALIIAGAILLSILIIALGIFVFNAARGAVNTDQLDATELRTFNEPITQYEGEKVIGSSVKSLLSELILNAGKNSDAAERLPDVKYVNTNGPEVRVGSLSVRAASNGDFTISSDIVNTNVELMSILRSKISSTHYYKVSVGFDNTTGLVNLVTITY